MWRTVRLEGLVSATLQRSGRSVRGPRQSHRPSCWHRQCPTPKLCLTSWCVPGTLGVLGSSLHPSSMDPSLEILPVGEVDNPGRRLPISRLARCLSPSLARSVSTHLPPSRRPSIDSRTFTRSRSVRLAHQPINPCFSPELAAPGPGVHTIVSRYMQQHTHSPPDDHAMIPSTC